MEMKYEEVYPLFPLRRQRKRERMGAGNEKEGEGREKKEKGKELGLKGRGKEGRREEEGGLGAELKPSIDELCNWTVHSSNKSFSPLAQGT